MLQENDATIHNLSNKIQTLEQEIDEQSNQLEKQSTAMVEQENRLNDESSNMTELTKQFEESTEKLLAIEKDFNDKSELYNEKVTEFDSLNSKYTTIEKNYSSLKLEYGKLQKENEMLVDKAAEKHIQNEQLTTKIMKYKKQLMKTTEDVKDKLIKLKQQKEELKKLRSDNAVLTEVNNAFKTNFNDPNMPNNSQKDLVTTQMELIKVKALLKEKEETTAKLLEKSSKDRDELKDIIENSVKRLSDDERQVIEQKSQQKLKEQREELEMQLNQKMNLIQDYDEKYSKAKIKIHELMNELKDVKSTKIRRESKKFKDEKKLIIKTLNEKNTKIEKQEKEIESWKIKYSGLESFLRGDQKDFEKMQNLIKNMNQVKQMYSQIVNSESAKQEKDILQRKLKRKEAKIKQLNDELGVTRSQVMKCKNDIHQLFSELSKYRKVQDENGSFILVNDIDKSIKPDSVKPTERIKKSRKGGKNKTDRNTVSFQDFIQMSSLKDRENGDNDEIKEQDEEDEEDSIQT